ncbi:MAG: hypothetical protein ABI867_22905 [Kofleriaceae bacterium]
MRWGLLLLPLLVACGGSDRSEPAWTVLSTGRTSSLLSVWGTSPDDVWVVGGRESLAGPPVVLHREADAWTLVDTGETGIDLWFTFGFEGGDVFFSGSGGAILRYRDGAFERFATPRTGILFGMWGASATDMWAVGSGDDGNGIVWRFDGTAWTEVPLPADVPHLVFKVHGQSSTDVWICAANGVTLHWDGVALVRQAAPTASSLFSVVTTADTAITVGGTTVGEIFELGSEGWLPVAPLLSPVAWRGVAAGTDVVFAVGESGAIAERRDNQWAVVERLVTDDFHAAWVDPDGGLWGVGGRFEALPLTSDGFLAYYGLDAPGGVVP